MSERFGELTSSRVRGGYDAAGWADGRLAADKARLSFGVLPDEAATADRRPGHHALAGISVRERSAVAVPSQRTRPRLALASAVMDAPPARCCGLEDQRGDDRDERGQ